MKNKPLYAFWKYSAFPFVLGGLVTDMRDDGRVSVKGYGSGAWFNPFKIVPAEHGAKIKEHLDALEREYEAALRDLRTSFAANRDAIIEVPK